MIRFKKELSLSIKTLHRCLCLVLCLCVCNANQTQLVGVWWWGLHRQDARVGGGQLSRPESSGLWWGQRLHQITTAGWICEFLPIHFTYSSSTPQSCAAVLHVLLHIKTLLWSSLNVSLLSFCHLTGIFAAFHHALWALRSSGKESGTDWWIGQPPAVRRLQQSTVCAGGRRHVSTAWQISVWCDDSSVKPRSLCDVNAAQETEY